jgi:hypothetical protein
MSTRPSPGWSWEPELAWEGFGASSPAVRPTLPRKRPSSPARRRVRRRTLIALTVIATVAFAGGLSTALLAPPATSVPAAPPAGIRSTAPSALIGGGVPSLAHRLSMIARCESGGDPTAVSPDGRYRGKYQFDLRTWRAVNGGGDPALAPEHVQDRLARELLLRRGTAPWPVCGASGAR